VFFFFFNLLTFDFLIFKDLHGELFMARQQAEQFLYTYLDKITGTKQNSDMYRTFLSSMSDKDFDEFVLSLKEKRNKITIIAPEGGDIKLDVKRNINIGRELGYEFFQKLWLPNPDGDGSYLTLPKYMICRLPIRRASQLLAKKIGVAKHSKSYDMLTGQPTGDSKGTSITYPETRLLVAMGLKETAKELLKYRGGDRRGFSAFNAMMIKYGEANMENLEQYSSGVDSTRFFKTILTCMHLQSTL
jgi:hypothetical protein